MRLGLRCLDFDRSSPFATAACDEPSKCAMKRWIWRLVGATQHPGMSYQLAADAVLLVHGAFILFAVFGALLALRWRPVLWLQAPAFAWATFVMATARICPLTPLENALRQQAGEAGYGGGFIEHYLLAVIYPDGLTRSVQIALGGFVLLIQLAVYLWLWRRRRH